MTVTVTSALAGPATARYSNVYGALVDLGVLSGLGAQDVTGSGDPVAPILNAAGFYAPLTHSLVLTRGTGSATFTRATKAWEFGYSAAANSGDSQVLMEIASGTPRFGGARYDSGTWYNTYADGSAISASSLLGYHAEGARTNSLLYSRDLRGTAGSWKAHQEGSELCQDVTCDDAAKWTTLASLTVSGGKLNISAGTAYTGFACIGANCTAGKTYTVSFEVSGFTSGRVRHIGGSAAGIIAYADGAYTTTFTALTTNESAYFQILDAGTTLSIDNVSIKKSDIQVTTCTGIDNAANSASTLTAGAADATILQTLSLAAAARSFSAYVKRRTGSGNIYITRDGGTTWTDVTSQINSSTWTRVKIENTSVLNPQVGFKIATSGDAIDVDVCQDEAGAFSSSPIVTTTAAVTRNNDSLNYQNANVITASGAAIFDITNGVWGSTNTDHYIFDAQSTGHGLGRFSGGAIQWQDSTIAYVPFSPYTNWTDKSNKKLGITWSGTTIKKSENGGTIASLTANFTLDANVYLACNSSGNGNYTYMKGVYIWQSALTDAQLQQVTS